MSLIPIGLLGCGTVGRVLATRLLRAGHAVTVHDRDRSHAAPLIDDGAHWADDPPAVAAGAGLVVSALPRPEDVETALLGDTGAWAGAAERTIHVDVSTIGPAAARRLAGKAVEKKIRFLDAPISRGAAEGSGPRIVMWVGGNADHFELARPVLEILADRVLYCGAVGQGQVTKLVNNVVAHSLAVIVGEALALGVRAGASLELLRAALHDGTAQNRMLDEMLPATAFRGDWRPGLRLALAEKDLDLAAELASDNGVVLSTVDRIRGLYRRAAEAGLGDLSSHAVLRLVEEAAGVELRSSIFEQLKSEAGPTSAGD